MLCVGADHVRTMPVAVFTRVERTSDVLLRDVFAYSLRWDKNSPTLMALLEEAHLRAANLEADGRYDVRMRVPRTMQDFKGPDAALLALAASNLEAQQHASRRIYAAPLIDEVGESATLHANPAHKKHSTHRVEAGLRPRPRSNASRRQSIGRAGAAGSPKRICDAAQQ